MASQAHANSAYNLEETPTIEDLTLSYNTRHKNQNKDFYWEKDRDTLRFPIVSSQIRHNVTKVLVPCDSCEFLRLRQILDQVIESLVQEMRGRGC